MTKLMIIACFLFLMSSSFAQSSIRGLPPNSVVLETRMLPIRNRTLLLWMLSPKKNPNGYSPDEPYTCPDQSRGSYYSGAARVSLVNSATRSIINTVKIEEDGGETFDLPYAIRRGYYYRVDKAVRKGVEARPTIMWLKDYNGDGQALEFALFDVVACMGLQTTLIGYSEKQDRVIQYPVNLEVIEGAKHSNKVMRWADYLFSNRPRRAGYWKYEVDYRGRGGSLDQWEVRYNPAKELFEGTLRVVPGE